MLHPAFDLQPLAVLLASRISRSETLSLAQAVLSSDGTIQAYPWQSRRTPGILCGAALIDCEENRTLRAAGRNAPGGRVGTLAMVRCRQRGYARARRLDRGICCLDGNEARRGS